MRMMPLAVALVVMATAGVQTVAEARQAVAAPSTTALSRAEQEQFLLNARIVKQQGVRRGVTGTVRVTLSDGTLTHDASVQVVDESRTTFQGTQGTEFNFRDTWKFNMAAYLLDKLLDLQMIPVSVERTYERKVGSFTWWVDDVLMDEADRLKKKIEPPDSKQWNDQMFLVRAFDQLIFNTDRNLGNLVISKPWRIWMIDHTRAFRWNTKLREAGDLGKCERRFLAGLRRLDRAGVERETGRYLGRNEIDGLLARRDLIVAHCDKGGQAALYDAPRFP